MFSSCQKYLKIFINISKCLRGEIEQVISVFCGVRGYLDDIDLKDIAEFELKILEKCKAEKHEIIDAISSSGKLEEDSEKLLVELITNLKKNTK